MKNMIRTTIAAALALLVNVSAKDVRPLNINTTTTDSMAAHLPGVGPSMALRIDSARKVAPLTSCADLDKIKGIGAKKLEKICPMVTF